MSKPKRTSTPAQPGSTPVPVADVATDTRAAEQPIPADAGATAAVPPPAAAEVPLPPQGGRLHYVVRARRAEGIWRAGRFWGPEPETLAADALTPGAVERLRQEPLIEIEEVVL